MNQPATAIESEHRPVEFSLVQGGPFYRLWLRTGLAKPPLELPLRRAFFFVVMSWVPLLLLSSLPSEHRAVSFLMDLEVNVRF